MFVCCCFFFFCYAHIFYYSLIADHFESIFKTTKNRSCNAQLFHIKHLNYFLHPSSKSPVMRQIHYLCVCVFEMKKKTKKIIVLCVRVMESEWERNGTIPRPSPTEWMQNKGGRRRMVWIVICVMFQLLSCVFCLKLPHQITEQ